MTKEETRRNALVMLAAADGLKIECCPIDDKVLNPGWRAVTQEPGWVWHRFKYRIKPIENKIREVTPEELKSIKMLGKIIKSKEYGSTHFTTVIDTDPSMESIDQMAELFYFLDTKNMRWVEWHELEDTAECPK